MAQQNNSANLSQDVLIDGKKYKLTGKVDFSELTITLVGDGGPTPPPEPPVEPTNPTEPTGPTEPGTVDPKTGTRKEGSKWSKNPGDPETWEVVKMTDNEALWKIVDKDGLNVIADLQSKEIAYQLIEYFKTHPFPPTDGTTTQPPIEPPVPPVQGSGTDKNGVQLLFAKSENVNYNVEKDTRGDKKDGIRWNWKIDGATASEAYGYFRFKQNPVDDEVSVKWSEKSHSGSNEVQCYDTGVEIRTGKARLRFENPHPTYSNNIGSGQGVPLKDKWIGYKGVKIPQADGSVLIELYQDTGDNEGAKPSNQWTKIYSHKDTKYKRTGAHPYITIRVDDPDKNGQKDLEEKWLGAAKI